MSNNSHEILAKRILDFPFLSQRETVEKIKEYRDGIKSAFDNVVNSHLYNVVLEVWRNIELPLTIDDMLGNGFLSLCEAVESYNKEKTSFKSYARSIIHWRLQSDATQYGSTVTIPLNLRAEIFDKKQEFYTSCIENTEDRFKLYIDEEYLEKDYYKLIKDNLLIFRVEHCEKNIKYWKINLAENYFEYNSFKYDLKTTFDSIPDREAEILRLYYGTDREYSNTLEEIGNTFNLTRERIRQLKEKAIRRLLYWKRKKRLKAYLFSYFLEDKRFKNDLCNDCSIIVDFDNQKKREYFYDIFGNIIEKHERKHFCSDKDYSILENDIVEILWLHGEPISFTDLRYKLDEYYENMTNSILSYVISKSHKIIKIKWNKYALKDWGYIPLV